MLRAILSLPRIRISPMPQLKPTWNARWRICFIFRKRDADDVEIVDYHKG